MLSLLFREVSQQLAGVGVGNLLDGPLIEAARLHLHALGLSADRVYAERPDQPHRPPLHETLNVVPPDHRNMIAETLLVYFEQSRAMTRLLGLHLLEHLRRGRVFLPQAIREVAVDAPV